MFHCYIIYSAKIDRYYVGSSGNLENRLEDHNNSRSNFTKKGKPWKKVWAKTFDSKQDALKEEFRIKKKKSRKYIEWLISSVD